jgi:hypothetical protein
MATITTLPKVHRAFYDNASLYSIILTTASVRDMLRRGFHFSAVLAVHDEFYRALAKEREETGAAIPWDRSEAIFAGIHKAKLESLSARELADIDGRAQRLAEIDLDSMSDAFWEALPRLMR